TGQTVEFSLPLRPCNAKAEQKKTSISGISKGGCLCLLASVMGTPYQVRTEKSVLFLEDVDEPGYKLDRFFTQLRLSGALEKVSAVVLGWFDGFKPAVPAESEARAHARKCFAEEMDARSIPVFSTEHFGHTP